MSLSGKNAGLFTPLSAASGNRSIEDLGSKDEQDNASKFMDQPTSASHSGNKSIEDLGIKDEQDNASRFMDQPTSASHSGPGDNWRPKDTGDADLQHQKQTYASHIPPGPRDNWRAKDTGDADLQHLKQTYASHIPPGNGFYY